MRLFTKQTDDIMDMMVESKQTMCIGYATLSIALSIHLNLFCCLIHDRATRNNSATVGAAESAVKGER